ncbi:hypothetical protein MHYP_G00205530 [Metynnis hypsauchen]
MRAGAEHAALAPLIEKFRSTRIILEFMEGTETASLHHPPAPLSPPYRRRARGATCLCCRCRGNASVSNNNNKDPAEEEASNFYTLIVFQILF